MAERWYYAVNGLRAGPVSTADMRRLAADGRLTPSDLVWHDGLRQWIRAGGFREFFTDDTETVPVWASPRNGAASNGRSDSERGAGLGVAKPPFVHHSSPLSSVPVPADAITANGCRRPVPIIESEVAEEAGRVDQQPARRRRRQFAPPVVDDVRVARIRRRGVMNPSSKKALLLAGIAGAAALVLFLVISTILNWPEVHTVPCQIQDRLTTRDPLDSYPRDNRGLGKPHYKVYWVHMEAGRTYQIDMMTHETVDPNNPFTFDPFVRLEDSGRRHLDKNDDGGEWPNARLIFRPRRTDDYRVLATSWSGVTGRYTLTVRETEEVLPPVERKRQEPQPRPGVAPRERVPQGRGFRRGAF